MQKHSCLVPLVLILWSTTLAAQQGPPTVLRQPAPTAFTSGPNGDLYMDSPAPFTTAGVLLQAHAGFPFIVARLGTADAASAFAVYNINNSEVFRVTADGKVGIGTTTPAQPLDVNGTSVFRNNLYFGTGAQGSAGFLSWATASPPHLILYGNSGYGISLGTNGITDRLFIDTSGNVGIGTTAPVAKFQVRSTGNYDGANTNVPSVFGNDITGANAVIGASGNGAIVQGRDTTNASVLLLNPYGGNVGIGTSLPSQKLDVNGTVKIAGGLYMDNDQAIRAGGGNQSLIYRSSASGIFLGSGDPADYLVFNAGGAEKLRVTGNGNVGIGTAYPSSILDIQRDNGALILEPDNVTANSGLKDSPRLRLYGKYDADPTAGVASAVFNWDIKTTMVAGGTNPSARLGFINPANGTEALSIASTGNIGIGQANPQYALDVLGNAHFSGAVTGGSIQANYQDVAEWVPSTETLTPCTVVVVDPNRVNHVLASTRAYDTAIAGVVSASPGIILGTAGPGQETIATTGRVKVKADATRSPIQPGDVLVTSDIPGTAMKSEPVTIAGITMHHPGTILGKALEPLPNGRGEILVLLSLQ